jgi:serine/threonine-protein kinase CHEK2
MFGLSSRTFPTKVVSVKTSSILFVYIFLLLFLFSELKYNDSCFGRDVPPNAENMDVWIFNSQNCVKKFLERISKCHFQIEREVLKDGEIDKEGNLNPAFITCHGRNGIYINEDKMTMGDRRILAHNDVIKLTKNHQLFIFQYLNLSPEISSIPKECTQKYYIGRTIGSGGCGVVRLIFNVKTFQKYAMKIIRKETNRLATTTIAYNAKILNEVKIMKSLSHPHVLSLVDCYESPDNVVIIMDYLEGKDMLHRITQYNPDSKRLSELNAKFFFLQACRGLQYLHKSFITVCRKQSFLQILD